METFYLSARQCSCKEHFFNALLVDKMQGQPLDTRQPQYRNIQKYIEIFRIQMMICIICDDQRRQYTIINNMNSILMITMNGSVSRRVSSDSLTLGSMTWPWPNRGALSAWWGGPVGTEKWAARRNQQLASGKVTQKHGKRWEYFMGWQWDLAHQLQQVFATIRSSWKNWFIYFDFTVCELLHYQWVQVG